MVEFKFGTKNQPSCIRVIIQFLIPTQLGYVHQVRIRIRDGSIDLIARHEVCAEIKQVHNGYIYAL